MLRVIVETSDRYNWALLPFCYLFNVFWSSLQPVIVCGYSRPQFRLPANFQFFSIDSRNYPAERWSDGMIKAFSSIEDEHFVFMLADYWLVRTVDVRGVDACHQYIACMPDVLRIDLTDDRQYAGGALDADYWGSYDIVETPYQTPYQMSTQAGIWNRRLFLKLLQPGKSAWQVEIETQPPESMRVLGTRQRPVRYANAIQKGQLDRSQIDTIPEPHRRHVLGLIPNP